MSFARIDFLERAAGNNILNSLNTNTSDPKEIN